MKKAFVFLLLGFCISIKVFAQVSEKISLETKEYQKEGARSIVIIPKAYQDNAMISITLPNTISLTTVTITNKVTGEQVYSMVYTYTSNIQIDLKAEDKGEYTINIDANNIIYWGDFVL